MNTNSIYEVEFEKLNTLQQKAVLSTEGPLMVIAGPGTGKTQLLSMRVGNILQKSDMQPHNILCITFTNSGVAAMKKRLVELIGAQGHDIEVHTFHGFAEKIISRYKQSNEMDAYEFHEEVDKKILVRSILEKVDFNTPLKKGISSVDSSISFLINFFNHIKKEKYDVNDLITQYEEEKKTKITDEEFIYKRKTGQFMAGDLKQDKWDKFCAKLDKHIQASRLYIEYQSIIEEKKLIDFDDLILNAIKLLEENDDLRYDFMEQYQYIMIDEFQDTNGAQINLINQLCLENDLPNIMVVGDEDQSIFRFQGANVKNINEFHVLYLSDLDTEEQLDRIIVLENNYRSTPYILEASRQLIEVNTERIKHIVPGEVIEKKLKSSHKDYKNREDVIDFIDVNSKEDLSIPIALEIEKMIQSGVKYSDIAVLFPTNQNAIDFSDYLKVLEYPFELSKEEDILEDSLILSYLQIFTLIQNFSKGKFLDKGSFSELLFHPWANISIYEISKFWAEFKEENPENILTYLKTYDKSEAIIALYEKLETCIKMQSILPPLRYFHYVLDSFGIKEWAISKPNRLDILQKIEVLENFIQEYLAKRISAKMDDILARIEDYIRETVAITYIKHIKSENSIQLMTFHKSKGLEFEHVFIYGAGRYSSSNMNKVYIPEVILSKKQVSEDEEKKSAEEEKRRLLYVAMTRAKGKLIMVDSGETDSKGNSKNKFKAELPIVDIEDHKKTPSIEAIMLSNTYAINEADYIKFEAVNQTLLDVKDEHLFENQYIENRIQNFNLSHSSINTYLECPQKFFVEKIITIPSESNLAMNIGNFYHSVLENYFKQLSTSENKADKNEFITLANTELFGFKHFMTEFEFKDVQKSLETNLPIIFDQYIALFKADKYAIEDNIDTKVGDANINGKLDKWYQKGNETTIIDFKTGKFSNAKKNGKLTPYTEDLELDPMTASIDELYGGNYWRQAIMYFLLASSKFQDSDVKETKFIFIIPEDNKIESYSYEFTQQDEAYIKNLILDVHTKIKAKKFEGCKKPECKWCSKLAERQSFSI